MTVWKAKMVIFLILYLNRYCRYLLDMPEVFLKSTNTIYDGVKNTNNILYTSVLSLYVTLQNFII